MLSPSVTFVSEVPATTVWGQFWQSRVGKLVKGIGVVAALSVPILFALGMILMAVTLYSDCPVIFYLIGGEGICGFSMGILIIGIVISATIKTRNRTKKVIEKLSQMGLLGKNCIELKSPVMPNPNEQ